MQRLTEQELRNLNQEGESQYMDRKNIRIHPRDFAEILIAFANADGGWALVGIEDDGTVSGVDPEADRDKINGLLLAARDYCQPPVSISYGFVPYGNKHVLAVDVHADFLVHNHTNGRVYLRVQTGNRPLNVDETLRLAYSKGQNHHGARPVPRATLNDLDLDLVREYATLRGLPMPEVEILRGLDLLVEEQDTLCPTVACVLLFGKRPQRWVPRCGIDFLLFKGAEESIEGLVKRETIEEALPHLIKQAWALVQDFVPTHRRLRGLVMEERTGYPEFAWREAIVNAVAHRDYSITGTAIQIRMFDDRLEVESPGTLPGIVTCENIADERFSRNPQIVGVLKAWKYIEDLGWGINRMIEEMELADLKPPEFRETRSSFIVTLRNVPVWGEEVQMWLEQFDEYRLNHRQRRAIVYIRNFGKITNREYRELNKMDRIDRDRALQELTEMVNKGIITLRGSGRGAEYCFPGEEVEQLDLYSTQE